jgi:hypothetical protein
MRTGVFGIVLALALGGCIRVPGGLFGESVSGTDVQRVIDTKISPSIRVALAGITVGPSRCPQRLDVSFGRTEYCVLPVGTDEIPIEVSRHTPYSQADVKLRGTIVPMSRLAEMAASDIAVEYGKTVRLDCGGGVELLEAGRHVRCTLAGTREPYADVEMPSENRFVTHELGAGPGRIELAMEPYLARHRAGLSTIVPGRVIEPYVRLDFLHRLVGQPERQARFQGASCPPSSDLSGAKRAICRISYAGGTAHYSAWIDDREGPRADAIDALIDTRLVSDSILATIRARLQAFGRTDLATVNCGPDRTFVAAVGAAFVCRALVGRDTVYADVRVVDSSGRIEFLMRSAKTAAARSR